MDAEYFSWPAIDDCMPVFSMCVTTGDDVQRVFMSASAVMNRYGQGANTRRFHYRPLDFRFVNHATAHLERPRLDVMENFYQANLGLVLLKQARRGGEYDYSFITTEVTDKGCLSTEANSFAFPLYKYTAHEHQAPILAGGPPQREDNVRAELLQVLTNEYAQHVSAEQIFFYIYAIVNAQGYLQAYAEQLSVGFPRIPFVKDSSRFVNLSERGHALVEALTGTLVGNQHFPFHNTGNAAIRAASIAYLPAVQSLQINDTGTTFGGITPEVWGYRVGTYQVLKQWLESRDGLTFVLELGADASQQVLIDEFRDIARRIAMAIPIHNEIDALWQGITED